MFKGTLFAIGMCVTAVSSQATTLLSENFDNVAGLGASGWIMQNQSTSAGVDWFQGNSGVFTAYAGADNAYIAANFLSSGTGTGVISNWLITPEVSVASAVSLSFSSRTEWLEQSLFGDRLQVYFSDSGSDATSFQQLLFTINPSQTAGVYPDNWTRLSVNLNGLGTGQTGRFGFRYAVDDAANANYIGLDSVQISAVPEPQTYALMGTGLLAMGAFKRRRRRTALLAAGALSLTLGTANAHDTTVPAPQTAVDVTSGMRVTRDAVTGELRAPTAAESKALDDTHAKRIRVAPSAAMMGAPVANTRVSRTGARGLTLGEEHLSYTVVQRHSDGHLAMQCVESTDAAHKAVTADSTATAMENNHE